MSSRACLWTIARLVPLLMLALPPAATAADPAFLRQAQATSRDIQYEDCATVCQQQIDRRIAQCPGYREIQNPADTSAPPPQCKRSAIEEFNSCMATCPSPPRLPQQG
jgi:hypothetical protein